MKLNEPGYPERVAVNTGSGVLTKVGGVRDRVGVVVNCDVSCISLSAYFGGAAKLATSENLWLRAVGGSAKTLGKRCYHTLFPVAQTN